MVRWVDYSARIIGPENEENVVRKIETAFRTCYNSTDKMKNEPFENSVKFVKSCISRGHHSPVEHANITIEATIDRGLLAEITRHRIGSFSVSSTRYIRYSTEVPCVMPYQIRSADDAIKTSFRRAIEDACQAYQNMLLLDVKPENARAILPQALAVTIIETHNIREWLHIFDLRYRGTTGSPHPDMRVWMHKVYVEFMKYYPHIFDEPLADVGEIEEKYRNIN